jgi:uncharacterized protein YjbI with pentapeptide repeats
VDRFAEEQGGIMDPSIDLNSGNLAGRDLAGADLARANLSRADLSGANLKGADLSGANLKGADLSGANLTGANLQAALTREANLDGADLSDADLSAIRSGRISGKPRQLPKDWILEQGWLIGPKADLSDANLDGLNLRTLNLHSVNLNRASLNECDLSDAQLSGIRSGKIKGRPKALPLHWQLVGGYLLGPKADLRQSTLTGVDLTGLDLSKAQLTGTSAREIQGAPLALPKHWHFRQGFLLGPGVNLAEADLTGVDLSGIDLTGANIRQARFSPDTLLTGTRLVDCEGTPSALPKRWRFTSGILFAPGIDASSSDLSKQDLSNLDLSNADLSNCELRAANLSSSSLNQAKLSSAHFGPTRIAEIGRTVSRIASQFLPLDNRVLIRGADLTGADLTGADLTGAVLNCSTITGAKFDQAILENCKAEELTGTPQTLPIGWECIDGKLVKMYHSGVKAAPSLPPSDLADQLRQLGLLHSQGVITDDEFSAAKNKILSN